MAATGHPSIEAILSGAGIRFAYLFGSRATGHAQDGSDADIAGMPSRPLGLLERERLSLGLARAYDVPEVDLVLLDSGPGPGSPAVAAGGAARPQQLLGGHRKACGPGVRRSRRR